MMCVESITYPPEFAQSGCVQFFKLFDLEILTQHRLAFLVQMHFPHDIFRTFSNRDRQGGAHQEDRARYGACFMENADLVAETTSHNLIVVHIKIADRGHIHTTADQ